MKRSRGSAEMFSFCMSQSLAMGGPDMALFPNRWWRPVVQGMFWLALAGASVLALMPQPPIPLALQVSDKWQHVGAFMVLTFLAQLAFAPFGNAVRLRLRIAERLSFLGALIEVGQSIPALHRQCDIFDWLADSFAIMIVTSLFLLVDGLYGQRRARG
ncbi:MAG: hypothetical protein WCY11_12690 [Novosphingobium sp.]